jgi:hypothetical protein
MHRGVATVMFSVIVTPGVAVACYPLSAPFALLGRHPHAAPLLSREKPSSPEQNRTPSLAILPVTACWAKLAFAPRSRRPLRAHRAHFRHNRDTRRVSDFKLGKASASRTEVHLSQKLSAENSSERGTEK